MSDKKLSAMDVYYRAYRDYMDSMKNVSVFNKLKTSLKNGAKNPDAFSGTVVHREIDTEWVEAIEAALPYIDKAIREQRRFIAQQEEIVPIAKSKKVTTESVRHLAQHTNLIGRVEDNKVTPKSILNIQREESFDIYENRFLRTLINHSIEFVGRCYTTIKDQPDSSLTNLQMSRTSFVEGQVFNVDLGCSIEYNEDIGDVDIAADVSTLTDFQRVIRLRKILSDFLATPLMMSLAGSPEVRSPITRTNLLTKDTNFREGLRLWEFFEHYDKPGFTVLADTNPGQMPAELQSGLYDVFGMLQFVVKMSISKTLRGVLEQNYEEENLRREKERQLEEERRLKEVQKQIQTALDSQKQEFDAVLEQTNAQHKEELEQQNTAWENKYSVTVTDYEHKIQDEKTAHANEITKINQHYGDEIKQLNQAHADAMVDTVNHYDAVVAEKEDRFKFELAEKAEKHQQEMDALQAANNANIEMISKDFMNQIDELTETNNQIRESYESQIETIKADAENERINAVTEAVKRTDDQYKTRIAAFEKNAAELDIRTRKCEENFAKIRLENKNLSKALSDAKMNFDTLQRKYASLYSVFQKREDAYKKSVDKIKKSYEKRLKKQAEQYEKNLRKVLFESAHLHEDRDKNENRGDLT